MMNLMTGLHGLGGHLGGWRHPDAWGETSMNLEHSIHIAQLAEKGKFDLLFLADGNAVRQMDKPALFAANSPSDRPSVFEPTTHLTAVAMFTKHIGLLATATTTYDEPYLLARRFASLDHLSKGRACWNVVTTSFPGDALNFSRTEHMNRIERYERSIECVEVCKGLWDSWDDGAFVQNKETGQYLDPAKVHVLNHKGKHFQIKGPLNVSRMPQGYPVLFLAGQSEQGREMAAMHADCVFSVMNNIVDGRKIYADIKGRLAKYGREPDHLKIIPGASFYVGRTESEADELYEELQSLITPTVGVAYLSKLVEMNLKDYPLDGPMPDLSGETNAIESFRKIIAAMATRDNLTLRQTYQRVLPSMGHIIFKGNPVQIVDQMEEWYKTKACDGFNVGTPVMPRGLTDFVDLIIPELQKRGLFRREYTGKTLRENMGLPMPRNQFFSHDAVIAAE
jgi:FMN-dependent oxidoreductase (nitrilotriacetate monooxygenase family)